MTRACCCKFLLNHLVTGLSHDYTCSNLVARELFILIGKWHRRACSSCGIGRGCAFDLQVLSLLSAFTICLSCR